MYPPLTLRYLWELTDDTGLLQHAKYCVPDRREGYATDDNARALVVVSKYFALSRSRRVMRLAKIYLSFLHYMQRDDGSFYNKLSYDRLHKWDTSEDCYGRAIWGCSAVYASPLPLELRRCAKEMLDRALSSVHRIRAPRGVAFTIIGLCELWKSFHDERVADLVERLASYLVELYESVADEGWRWFEEIITYENARLPQALFEAYLVTGETQFLKVACEAFDFLKELTIVNGVFWPIGNRGWYQKGGERALYDQQPVEAGSMVESSLSAFEATRDPKYLKVASVAMEWYFGRNSLRVNLYDEESGGCFDGITPEGLNYNMGAEATLSYLLARLKLEQARSYLGDYVFRYGSLRLRAI